MGLNSQHFFQGTEGAEGGIPSPAPPQEQTLGTSELLTLYCPHRPSLAIPLPKDTQGASSRSEKWVCPGVAPYPEMQLDHGKEPCPGINGFRGSAMKV